MPPKICLNMIVKNESHIIVSTLTNILENVPISHWVICDTGSTDNTPLLITSFFEERKIPGELYHDPWVDFGTNRTNALRKAYNKDNKDEKDDYLLIFDADDCFRGNFILPPVLIHDMYYLKMSGGQYYRPLLINNNRKWKFTGVLHEYLEKDENIETTTMYLTGDYSVESRRLGARSQDPQKYVKDATILKEAYEVAIEKNDSIANRYVFYCANSFRDAGYTEEALKWYKKTLDHQGWVQEKYISCLRIYESLEKLGRREEGFYYLIKSYAYDQQRLECMHKLITHYCCENQNEISYAFYELIKNPFEEGYLYDSNNKLFIYLSIGDFYLPYIMIIVADRLKKRDLGVKMYEIIFKKKYNAPEWYLKNLIFNMRFFIEHFTANTLNLLKEYRISYSLFDSLCEKEKNN